MLSNVSIKALYGLYSYTLDFHPEQKPYRFVTGPNAYGKTSLLRMIESLYKQDFDGLSKVVFDKFQLVFNDGFQIHVGQQRIYDDDPNSDDTLPKKVVLSFLSKNTNSQSTEVSFEWESDKASEIKLNNLTAYLASHPIYFITDNRLYTLLVTLFYKVYIRSHITMVSQGYRRLIVLFCKLYYILYCQN